MKINLLPAVLPAFFLFFGVRVFAQMPLDSVMVKPLKGAAVPFSSLVKKDTVVLLCFWSSGSESSIRELNAINAKFGSWKKLANFHLLAVCVDEGRDLGKLRPLVNAAGWTFEVCIDVDGNLRTAVHSAGLPQSMILYKNEPVYQQSGFEPGSEDDLIKRVQQAVILHR
ncbi:MAG: hypothetical protein P4L51_11530 [Puia sp.]|nr:hypothetical protein [Puia sp.]